METAAISAVEKRDAAASRDGFEVAAFFAAGIAASVVGAGVAEVAEGAGGEFLLASSGNVAEFLAVTALGGGVGGNHPFAFPWAG